MTRLLLVLALVSTAASAQIDLTRASCATNGSFTDGPPPPTVPNGHIAWPADPPVWELDVYRPANRTTLNGGGLEIRNVTYRGRTVFDRASVPVLNVEYDAGGCGCFRDWQTQEASVEVGPGAVLARDCGTVSENLGGTPRTLRSGIAVSAPGAVASACETNEASSDPGGDAGDFVGIAVEDYGDELVVTGHSRAGWYRYRMKWHFYADGRVWPEFSFAATDAVCTETGHRHHAYWRFDFDLDGTPHNDVVREHRAGGEPVPFTTEASRVLTSDATFWSVVDADTGIGYEIVPGDADRRLPADPFSKTDALVLRYRASEIDDGRTVSNGCAFAFEPFVNGEAMLGADAVFWYRAGALHTAGSPFECDIVGPMLRPVGFNTGTAPGPGGAEFEPVRPNPFSGTAETRFRVAVPQQVSVELYDLTGRRVAVLFEGAAPGGTWQTVRVDGRALPAGTYVVRLRGETASGTTRVVLVR